MAASRTGGVAVCSATAGFGLPQDAGEYRNVRSALAMVSGWWRQRAEAAGLTGPWTSWRHALPEPPIPVPHEGPAPLVDDPWMLGRSYSEALHPRTRSRGGRHYTPRALAETR